MKRLVCLIVCVAVFGLVCAGPARAHFLWLLPSEPSAKTQSVRLIFSEDLKPDRPELLQKIAHTELFVCDAEGNIAAPKPRRVDDDLKAEIPGKGLHRVAGVCRYGVFQRGGSGPILLHYYAKTFVGLPQNKKPTAREADLFLASCDKLPLEVVPLSPGEDSSTVRVLWQGKPLPDAPYVLLVPGQEKKVEGKSDEKGCIRLVPPDKNGVYGIRVLHREAKAGEVDGKKYKEVRHYFTMTVANSEETAPPPNKPTASGTPTPTADPAATKLLADARAARALYHDFPGFSADVEINLDGKATRGKVEVSGTGKVTLQVDNPEAEKWAKSTLASIIGHRLSGGPDQETPCAFADQDTHHPLGRAIRVLNDEFHSSYRIRDRQVIVVNRQVPGARFTITVMKNIVTKEKKFLPACYVVNTWDAKTDALTSSETHHQTWQRVGPFDLPKETLAVKATAGKLESRSIKLSKMHLRNDSKQ